MKMDQPRAGKRKSMPDNDIIYELSESELSGGEDTQTGEPPNKLVRTGHEICNEISLIPIARSHQETTSNLGNESMETIDLVQDDSTIIILDSTEPEGNVEVLDEEAAAITIKFRDAELAELYKSKFVAFLQSFIELDVDLTTNDLSINVNRDTTFSANEWVIVNNCPVEENSPEPETPKKNKKSKKSKKELFKLDSTPSIEVNDVARYEAKFSLPEKPEVEEQIAIPLPSKTCFNCDQQHAIKDCPYPKNFTKINAARQKKRTPSRYHLEDDQVYGHLKPGVISKELREALGLRPNQLPSYIYGMRQLGYPPGWLEEAKIVHSNLSMFGVDDIAVSVANHQENIPTLDPEKIIEYPGFNAPLGKGFSDEYRMFRTPPYTRQMQKQAMIDYYQEMAQKEKDDLRTRDMDLDDSSDNDEECTVKNKDEEKEEGQIETLTLTNLEQQKEALLAELNDAGEASQSQSSPAIATENKPETALETEVLDTTVNLSTNSVKTSSFGTPILKSSSPYNRLPQADNFTKDVSPVIYFENLPNSTGKYEQMTGILQKVRTTMKNLQNCNS